MTMDELEFDPNEDNKLIEQTRRRVAVRIAENMDGLIDSLFDIANDPEEDSKVRLAAINSLLERSLPKLGVEHAKEAEAEESGNAKAIRAEIESLLRGDDDEDGLGGILAGRK
jgi:hypothetical protein